MEISDRSRWVWTVGAGVLFCHLGLDVEDALAKDGEIIEGVGGVAIHSNMSLDNVWEHTLEMHAGPVLVDAIFTELTEKCLELGMVMGPKHD